MENLLSQLDLQEYTKSYEAYLARPKPLFLEGDIHLHYKLIKELFNHQSIKSIPDMINLDRSIAILQKSGVLRIEEIYAYVKIIRYFTYLKKAFLDNALATWMDKIVIPENLLEIGEFFDDNGEFKNSIDETFESISKSLHLIKADFFYEASRYVTAGLDISDGLSKDLSRLCKCSRNRLTILIYKLLFFSQ